MRDVTEFLVEWGLFIAAAASVLITVGIVFTLIHQSIPFFQQV